MLDSLFSIKLLDISSIYTDSSPSDFSNQLIEKLSSNFLEIRRNSIPILVERKGLDEFRVVHGNLTFFACKRAQEKNSLFSNLAAIILDKKNEAFILEQWSLLDKEVGSEKAEITEEQINYQSLDLVDKINNLEKTLTNSINSLSNKMREQQKSINELLGKQQDNVSYLEQINNANVVELTRLLDKHWGLSSSSAEKLATRIITERNKNGKFINLLSISERVYTLQN